MNTWKVILATMVIFGTGVVTGGLLVHSTQRSQHARSQQTPNQPRPPVPGPAGALRIELLRRMERELDLKPEQRERVDKILKEGQEQTRRIMEPVDPELRRVIERAREEFLAVLTPEQRARFEELLKQQQQQLQHLKEQHKSPPSHQPGSLSTTNSPSSL